MFSWAPYLLNQFLIDCHDAQDNGTEFHYSWLIILIALAGWQEPKFSDIFGQEWESVMRPGMSPSGRKRTIRCSKENNSVFHVARRHPTTHNECVVHTNGGSAGDRGDSQIQGIQASCMDPSREGSQEGVAEDAVLHHERGSGLDHQRLACAVAVTSRKTNHEDRHNA
jgi:hypothetical protein